RDPLRPQTEVTKTAGERCGAGRLHGAEAAVAAASVRWAERPAPGLRHGAQAGGAMGHHDADRAALFALQAHAVPRYDGTPAGEERRDHLQELALVDRTASQLEIDVHVVGDGRRMLQRCDVVRAR